MTCDQLLLRNQYNYVQHASQQDSKNLIYIEIAEIILSNMRSSRAGARTLIGGGGGGIFIYSGYARLISFEINFITKETSRA